MASISSTATSSISSLDTRSNSRLIVGGLITRESSNQENPFPPATARVCSANREPYEIPSPYALSLTSGVESNHFQDQPPDTLTLSVRRTTAYGSWITPQTAQPKDNLETCRISNASSQRIVSSDFNSPPQLLELWIKSFLDGCWSNTQSDLYAARVVSYGPWTAKSTPDILAKMFRAQYTRAFTDPWVFNTGTSRVTEFLEAVTSCLERERGLLLSLEFRACLRRSALNAFHLTIDLAGPGILQPTCYLGVTFRHRLVSKSDILCALARIARLAKRIEYFQAFYYLLIEAGEELYSQPSVIQEIRRHAWVLWDALADSDEPVSSLRWHILIDELIETYEPRSRLYQDPATGETSWLDRL